MPQVADIQGTTKSVKSLLSEKYRIDYYQREYRWETRQVRDLISDLSSRFKSYHDDENSRAAVATYGQYFLGSIIVSNRSGVRYIVDGQQRLTSLTLLLIFLRIAQSEVEEEQRVDIDNLIYSVQFGARSFNLDIENRERCVQALVDDQWPPDWPDFDNQIDSVKNLCARYEDIMDCFPDDLKGETLPYFIDWLIEKVKLVEITAFSDDDAYTIFETMNDRGLSLTPTEMLKGYLLANIDDDLARDSAHQSWNGSVAAVGSSEISDCIKAWLRGQFAETIRARRAGAKNEDFERQGTEFHRWVRDNREALGLTKGSAFSSFVERDFRFYTRVYRFVQSKAGRYEPPFEAVYYNAQNKFTLQYPMIMAAIEPSDSKRTWKGKVRLVSTFVDILLNRRIWNFKAIDHSTMQYRAFLMIKEIRGKGVGALRQHLVDQLSSAEANGEEVEFGEGGYHFGLHGRNRPQIHRVLARLSDLLERGSGGQSRYREFCTTSSRAGGYQIEHVIANQFGRHKREFADSQDFEVSRNMIGGLLLLPGLDNASYQDLAYAKKVTHYGKQNLLARSLVPIAYERSPGFLQFKKKHGLPFEPLSKFGKKELEERQALYVELAKLCWSVGRLDEIE